MLRVHEWAAAMAVEEAYGIAPELLSDDRIGRALDAVAPQLDAIVGGVRAAAVTEFGIDVSRLHWDLTSISLYGAYPEADLEYPAPRWGHPRDRRPDLKQIQAGLAVSGDGGIPLFYRPCSGGAGEVAQVVGAMTALRQIVGPRPFLLVGDSKLISHTTAAAMGAKGVGFVAPLAASRVPAGLFAALPPGAGAAVDYAAERDAGKPAAADRGSYRVLEDGGMDLPGPRKADPPVHLRRILVYFPASAAGAARARARKLATATEELDRLVRTAGTRFHPTADAVAARVTAITARRRVKAYLRTAITHGATGKPVLSWHFDQAARSASSLPIPPLRAVVGGLRQISAPVDELADLQIHPTRSSLWRTRNLPLPGATRLGWWSSIPWATTSTSSAASRGSDTIAAGTGATSTGTASPSSPAPVPWSRGSHPCLWPQTTLRLTDRWPSKKTSTGMTDPTRR
jgi:hypothetical protein